MLGDKKKSSNRLSGLFSKTPSDTSETKTTSTTSSQSTGRLTKVRNRISSATHLAPEYPPPTPPAAPRHVSLTNPTIQPVEAPESTTNLAPLEPPHAPALTVPGSRNASPTGNRNQPGSRPGSRPGTPNDLAAEGNLKKLRRRSKLFGGSQAGEEMGGVSPTQNSPLAWIAGHKGQVPYNLAMLLSGERVPELWDPEGDTFVYLFPRTSDKGPSFRIDSSVYAASQLLTRLVHGSLYSDASTAIPQEERQSRRVSREGYGQSRTASPDQSQIGSSNGSKGSRALSDATEDDHTERHLYMPISLSSDQLVTPQEQPLSMKDTDTLVTYRNFFAFLIGQSLVATERHSDIFDIFLRIADILQHYAFSNVDGSSFGEVASSSFDCYVEELNLGDVRHSREKTIEAIVLGEKMRSMSLYTEGFVHAAGKFDSIKELQSPKFDMVSSKTATRLARAAMDLDNREAGINSKLKDFEFPAIFSGIMNSAMAEEGKTMKFKNWRAAFNDTRSFILTYYKLKYGSWLPKAKSKKNNLTTSGLNRLVLLDIYRDMSSLYDLLVDRNNLTIRTADGFLAEDEGTDYQSVVRRALRKVLSEYDRSTPPVQPPVPFDLPLYPAPKATGDIKKDTKARAKKLNKDEVLKALKQSHNIDAEQQTPFLEAFRHFEFKQASGATMNDLWDQRSGQWLLLYAIIQSLPMLVVDAPGVCFTEGVEYFLCEVPRSGVPWGREDTARARTWFGVGGGAQVVSLPTDIVEHGVEGVFRRSHCWKRAQQWAANDTVLNAAMQELSVNATPLPPPPGLLDPSAAGDRSRSNSPVPDRRRESVMNLGLEALPLPPGIAPPTAGSPQIRPASSSDPSRTFDDILGTSAAPPTKDKKKKK